MKHLFKFIATVAVFAMTIGSGFAMDNNPPAEPVKAMVETVVVEEINLQTPTPYTGEVAFKDLFGNCYKITPAPTHCSLDPVYPRCTISMGGLVLDLYSYVRNPITNEWECDQPLYRLTPTE